MGCISSTQERLSSRNKVSMQHITCCNTIVDVRCARSIEHLFKKKFFPLFFSMSMRGRLDY